MNGQNAIHRATLAIMIFLVLPMLPLNQVQGALHKPFGDYHAVPDNRILYPRLGAPLAVKTDSSFSVYLKPDMKDISGWAANIQSLFDKYDLTVEKSELDNATAEWKLTVHVPDSVVRGLYNLTVAANKPAPVQFSEPNAIFVSGPSYPSVLKVAVISDTHYGTQSPYYDITTSILRRSIDALNALGLDLVIGNGDMTDATVDPQVFIAMRAEFVRLRVPIFLTPGNNDHQSVLRGVYLWEEYLAPNSATLDYGNYHFISVDSQEGSIADEQLQWAREDLAAVPAGVFKIMIFHFPYWTEVHPSLKIEIPKIIATYGVGLVLTGHWHYDEIDLKPTLNIVTTSLSTSDQYVGYRLLNLTSTGVQYSPKSIPSTALNVTYLQRNDYSSTGEAVVVENGLGKSMNLTLTLLLRNSATPSDKPTIEGAAILRSTSTKTPNGREAVQASITLGSGQRQLLKVYYERDSTPPIVSLGSQVTGSTVRLVPVASDVGLGVLSLHVYYSTDNSTWTEVVQKIVDRVEVWVFNTVAQKVYLKAEVVDAAGLRTTLYKVVEPTPTATTPTQTAQPPTPPNLTTYLTVISIAIIVLLAILYRRRRRRNE